MRIQDLHDPTLTEGNRAAHRLSNAICDLMDFALSPPHGNEWGFLIWTFKREAYPLWKELKEAARAYREVRRRG